MSVVALVGCGEKAKEKAAKIKAATDVIIDPIIEKAIRKELKKPTGELTEADLGKVTELFLSGYKLTEVPKGLKKLTQLTWLFLTNNFDLTKAQIDEFQKALPNCDISSNPTK